MMMRWVVLFLVASCSFDQSGVAFHDAHPVNDSTSNADALVAPDTSAVDGIVDARPPADASSPDAETYPACTTDQQCLDLQGPFHCCYNEMQPPPTPGFCVEGNVVPGTGCVPADDALPDAGP